MDQDHIMKRIEQTLADIEERRKERLDEIKAKGSAAGTLRSGATLKAGVVAFAEALDAGLNPLLADFSRVVGPKHGNWQFAHDATARAVHEAYDDIAERARGELPFARGEAADRAVAALHAKALQTVDQKIEINRKGWNSTEPESKASWPEQHPYVFGGGAWVVGAFLGAIIAPFGDDIRVLFYNTLGIAPPELHQSKPGGSESSPASPPPGAVTPAA